MIRRLAVVNAEDKFRIAAELVYDSSNLPRLMPQGQRGEAIARIVKGMKGPFGRIQNYSADDKSDVAMASLAGAAADRLGYQQVHVLTRFWSNRQDLRAALDAGLNGMAPVQNIRPDPADPAPVQDARRGNDPPTVGRRGSRRDQSGCRPTERGD